MVEWGRAPWESRAAVMGKGRESRKVGETTHLSVERASPVEQGDVGGP
jgi:hypothetical protein